MYYLFIILEMQKYGESGKITSIVTQCIYHRDYSWHN